MVVTTSSSNSASSALPLPPSTSSTSSTSSTISAVRRSLMHQSTIYRRHEARRARTYRLRDDPRPPAIRVLSLLPGLHIIVPRYDPEEKQQPQQGEQQFSTTSTTASILLDPLTTILGNYSEDTLFLTTTTPPPPTTTTAAKSTGVTIVNHNHPAWQTALQAMVATGGTAAMTGYMWGAGGGVVHSNTAAASSASSSSTWKYGVSRAAPAGAAFHTKNPFALSHGAAPPPSLRQRLFLFLMTTTTTTGGAKFPAATAIAGAAASNTTTRKMAAVGAAFPAAILFGTKTYLDGGTSSTSTSTISSMETEGNFLFSSAMAGGLSGLVAGSPRLTVGSSTTTTTTALQHLPAMLGHSMIGGIAYFGTYDWIKKSTATTPAAAAAAGGGGVSSGPPHLPSVALAGAVAGSVQSVVLQQLPLLTGPTAAAASTTSSLRGGVGQQGLRLLLRVAPTHALLWCAYESMRYHCRGPVHAAAAAAPKSSL